MFTPNPRHGFFLASSVVLVLVFFAFARNGEIHAISQLRPSSGLPSTTSSSNSYASSSFTASALPSRKIWQTAKSGPLDLDEQSQANVKRWIDRNPDWRYELLTDYGMDTYVRDRFAARPDIVDVFTALGDSILRADFIRYLVLLADGGVYSDLDTECIKPIAEWLPSPSSSAHPSGRNGSSTSSVADETDDLAVVGIEYDTFGEGHVGALLDLQLINWTLMSRRGGHGLFDTVARRVVAALHELAANQSVPLDSIKANFNDVLANTGPAMLTLSTWEYLTQKTGKPFDWRNVTGITEPLHVHDVLILPVTSWGNGQAHSHAGPEDDPKALVHHQFKGGWKTGDHSFEHVKSHKGSGARRRLL